VDGCQEVCGSSIVAVCPPAEMLELVEESLNTVSEFIRLDIVRDLDFSVPFGGNNDLGICLLDHFAEFVGVVSFVCDDTIGGLSIQQVSGGCDIMGLCAGQDKAQRPAFCIGESVDFGGQSSSGTPQSLVFVPPFPFAAC
jgi:hypothetical protein